MSLLWQEVRHWLDAAVDSWAKSQGLEVPAYTLEEPPGEIEADAACNLPMVLAKPLRKAPRVIAQELQKVLAVSPSPFVESITIAGAGFLNIHFAVAALHQEMKTILNQPQRYGQPEQKLGEKILLEFVSANPTGPLHVGHGRGAALGDSLGLILSHLGYDVQREYYINDAGNQVQLLAESVRARTQELAGQKVELPAEGYHGDYIKDVAKAYKESHPNGLGDLNAIQSFALERMIKAIEGDLADFGIHFDSWFSEASVVQKGLVDKHIQTLKQRGYVQEYDNAVWFIAPGEEGVEKDKDRVLKRKDGRWTYFATDIAYHADKLERGFQKLIDVWGADHHGYVPRVKGSLQALGYNPDQLHIVLYQLVSLTRGGVPVSMSKRSGDFITMREVLEEVGRDACRFFFAMRGPNTALDFDLELAKKHTEENPVYYLQYAHARICSIFKQAPASEPLKANLDLLKEKEERALMKRLALFPQSLTMCAQTDSPHPLANYLLSLGRQFHFFYDHHRVLGVDPALTQARLALLESVRQVLRLGLKLLGVSAPDSM